VDVEPEGRVTALDDADGAGERIVDGRQAEQGLRAWQLDSGAEGPKIEALALGHLWGADDPSVDDHLDLAVVGTVRRDGGWIRELRMVAIVADVEMTDLPDNAVVLDGQAPVDDETRLTRHTPGLAVGPLFAGSASDEVVVLSTVDEELDPELTEIDRRLYVVERTSSGPEVKQYQLPNETSGVAPSFGRGRLVDYDGDGDLDVFVFATNQVQGVIFVNDGTKLVEGEPRLTQDGVIEVASLRPPYCFPGETSCE
jgi:hypothetical protein